MPLAPYFVIFVGGNVDCWFCGLVDDEGAGFCVVRVEFLATLDEFMVFEICRQAAIRALRRSGGKVAEGWGAFRLLFLSDWELLEDLVASGLGYPLAFVTACLSPSGLLFSEVPDPCGSPAGFVLALLDALLREARSWSLFMNRFEGGLSSAVLLGL